MRRLDQYCLLGTLLWAACGAEDNGEGTAQVRAYGEEFIEEGTRARVSTLRGRRPRRRRTLGHVDGEGHCQAEDHAH